MNLVFYGVNNFGDSKEIKINFKEVGKAILDFWNYEMDVFDVTDGKCVNVFSPYADNEHNSNLLKPYGLSLRDGNVSRELYNLETDEVYKFDWE